MTKSGQKCLGHKRLQPPEKPTPCLRWAVLLKVRALASTSPMRRRTSIWCLTSSESEEDMTSMLKEELSEWASMFHVKHSAIDALLTILKRHGHADLPQTVRTLFDRSNKYEVNTRDGVDIIKLTVSDQLSKHLSRYPTALTEHLQSLDLSLNIDGLPLFKSSNLSLWPVLCSINLTPACIFP